MLGLTGFFRRAFAILALLCCAHVLADTPAAVAPTATADARLVVFNRSIIVFRSTFLGASPSSRAERARLVIEEALRQGDNLAIAVKPNPEGQLLMIGDRLAFVVTAGDAEALSQERAEDVAQRAKLALEQVVAETRESRNVESLMKALIASTVATLVFLALVWSLNRLRNWVAGLLLDLAQRKAESLKIGGAQLVEGSHLVPLLRRLLILLWWLLVAMFSYEWLSFVLSRFPYTRPWGEQLNGYLFSVVSDLLLGMASALPGLGVAVAIFFIARFVVDFIGRLFQRIAASPQPPAWLAQETVDTTRRLVAIAIWLFAIAMAYPYLPGAQTEAFKGLSVLLGLMVSLGASSIVGQGAAGLILTYTGTIRIGEFVRIGEHEGTVTEMGMFTTRIRTGLGEELTLPNSMITGAVTKNYSRTVKGRGYIIDTTVTIGYDTPWRQVEAMLVEAAKRTPGILEYPAPAVFQTALSDYYPEYRLVAQAVPSQPRPRAEVLTALHENIQDVFNEYGVQIMSPHYLADPAEAKVVPKDRWYPAPARKSEG